MDSDAAFFGMDAEAADPTPPACEVWEEHREILHTFLACSTQWQHAGMDGGRTGLHYPSVESVLRLTVDPDQHREVFAGVQVMEQAALKAFFQQAEHARPRKKR